MKPLTPRQRQVIALRASGLTIKETADRLTLSDAAIKNHSCAAYQRLAVENLTEALRALGWLTVPEEAVAS